MTVAPDGGAVQVLDFGQAPHHSWDQGVVPYFRQQVDDGPTHQFSHLGYVPKFFSVLPGSLELGIAFDAVGRYTGFLADSVSVFRLVEGKIVDRSFNLDNT